MPCAPFAVLRNGEPIQLYPLKDSIHTGIETDDLREILGMIPEYEEREACVFSGYAWREWLTEDIRERAAAVAHYRLHNQITRHAQDAASRWLDRKRTTA